MEERQPAVAAIVKTRGDLAARVLVSLLLSVLLLALLPEEAPAWQATGPAKEAKVAAKKAVKEAVQSAVAEQDTVRSHDIVIGTPPYLTINQEGSYIVPEGEVRTTDVYTWAQRIDISGTLDGDIIAGFQSGEISGTVTQDVNGASNTMTISGEVGDDVRFACETFYVSGRIGGDLLVAGRDVQILPGAVVEGDVLIACGTATIDGEIGGRARVFTGALGMNGTIAGNAEITTDGGIRFGPEAHIGGDLVYEGPSAMRIPEGIVAGSITWHEKPEEEFDSGFEWPAGASAFFHFLGFIMALVAGSVIVALTKGHARRTAEIIRTKPLKSLGIGFVTFICMPIVLLILLVLIITAPLMFVGTLAYLIMLYIAKFYVAIWLGNLILRRSGRADVSPIPSLLLGLVPIYLATAIPILGTFIGIVIIFFGIGALLQRKETRLDSAFEPAPAPAISDGLPNSFPGDRTGE
jgi:cytoskeletal protein CcmA (bactofilin family)